MGVQAYKLVNRSERERLAGRVQEVVRAFIARVTREPAEAACTVSALGEGEQIRSDPKVWMVGTRSGMTVVAVGLSEGWTREFARLLLGGALAEGLDAAGLEAVGELGDALLQECGAALAVALEPSGTSPEPPLQWERGSALQPGFAGQATMMAACNLGEQLPMLMVLGSELVLGYLAGDTRAYPGTGALEPLRSAIHSGSVPLEVVAGGAEMAVGELATIKVGDVIKLDRTLEQPLTIRVRDGQTVGTVFLAAHRGRTVARFTTEH